MATARSSKQVVDEFDRRHFLARQAWYFLGNTWMKQHNDERLREHVSRYPRSLARIEFQQKGALSFLPGSVSIVDATLEFAAPSTPLSFEEAQVAVRDLTFGGSLSRGFFLIVHPYDTFFWKGRRERVISLLHNDAQRLSEDVALEVLGYDDKCVSLFCLLVFTVRPDFKNADGSLNPMCFVLSKVYCSMDETELDAVHERHTYYQTAFTLRYKTELAIECQDVDTQAVWPEMQALFTA